jgi:hypothetical protein
MTATPHRNASSPVPSRARNHRQSWPARRATPPRERPSTRQIYVFADESGDFDFSNQAASKYFTLGTIVLYDPTIGDRLLALRRQWASEGLGLNTTLHATEDEQAVRDRVFTFLGSEDFEADFTVLEKRKLPTSVRSQQALYKDAWTRHFKTMGTRCLQTQDQLLVVVSALGLRGERAKLQACVDEAARWTAQNSYQVAFWPCDSDPCLQIADYCTWAVHRKYERHDKRSYNLIKAKIKSEELPLFDQRLVITNTLVAAATPRSVTK